MKNIKKNNLFNRINKIQNNFDIFITPELTINKNILNSEREKVLKVASYLEYQEVILLFKDNLNLAKWLYYLDGFVSQMIILSKNMNTDEINELIDKSKVRLILSDENVNFKNHNMIYVSSLEDFVIEKNTLLKNKNANNNTDWVIATSGTSGHAKLVIHSLDSLTQSTKSERRNDIWGLLYNLDKFAGIQVYLQAILSGSPLVIPKNNQSLIDTSNFFSNKRVTSLSATPSLWKKLLMVKNVEIKSLRNITLGGETAKNNILSALKRKFPDAKIKHIYASTEAGTGFVVSDGIEGFPVKFLDNEKFDLRMKIGSEGTLFIQSPSNAKDYLGKDKLSKKDEFIDTGDLIEIKNDRCYFVGRINSAINIGGVKVYPDRIEEVLENMPEIDFAKVKAKKSSILGNLIEAYIVIQNDNEDIKKFKVKVRNYCSKFLEREMIPSFITIEKDISLSSSGKIKRNE